MFFPEDFISASVNLKLGAPRFSGYLQNRQLQLLPCSLLTGPAAKKSEVVGLQYCSYPAALAGPAAKNLE